MRSPGLAAVLSLIVPGVGQFYNGRVLAGILWLVITPGLWLGTGGCSAGSRTSSRPTSRTGTRVSTGCGSERPVVGSVHPIVASFQPGEDWRWCYEDEALV